MSLIAIGFTLDVIGKVLIALSVFFVHNRLAREKKIDKLVIKDVRTERIVLMLGILFIIAGYILQVESKFLY